MAKPKRADNAPKIDRRSRIETPQQFTYSGKEVRVTSSNVFSIRYDKPNHRLWVRFRNGALYKYDRVSLQTAQSMFSAPSMGKFVWRRLRGRYPYSRVE